MADPNRDFELARSVALAEKEMKRKRRPLAFEPEPLPLKQRAARERSASNVWARGKVAEEVPAQKCLAKENPGSPR